MRFSNQVTGNLSSMLHNNNVNNSDNKTTNCDNSSDTSDSIESIKETTNNNNNNSMMSDNFSNWNISARHDIANGLMKLNKKAFTVLCEPESENNENREFRQVPTAR